ncbi:alkaline shock response membrane anchor protein AmaP [Leuconostoc citreum]|uniref:alkaline shock response membrane anchor protein AmaP n=1 Tax=Leuconostoc citreum TaxID=33964 RepID=UPI00112282EC|nr:alkaline shock response membrane anchor protein AmaP [Leuconostoc citreum]TOY70511.1 alkaline shock response membrane anchor protein AmaP [Leuconostoc citreum]
MKKWQKVVLSFSSIVYLVGIALLIWPDSLERASDKLNDVGFKWAIDSQMIITDYGFVLLALTVLIFLAVVMQPTQKKDILLLEGKQGRLALSNDGINHFIRTELSGEGLTNVRVKMKNTRRQKQFKILADATYQQHVIAKLPEMTEKLTQQISTLMAGVDQAPIKINIQINKSSSGQRKTSRVI